MSEQSIPEHTSVDKKSATDPKTNPSVDELSEVDMEQVAGGVAAEEDTITVGGTYSWAR